jgi:hypothetical protein
VYDGRVVGVHIAIEMGYVDVMSEYTVTTGCLMTHELVLLLLDRERSHRRYYCGTPFRFCICSQQGYVVYN